ncbi:C5a anaphylatoxin chemotactic receptor 1 [Maylandia zebra]|uniref:Complement C5a receptor 1 n=1 Tax=Astatotilapia calliptera TaxID=8154 RepID=A0A3P8NBL8_ASTCA|nr:C5a anaphylatoxin chemotactic receptor 1 [Maylandia zebra]XP_026048637.1 C5a anaphylatoxin chemotactic receptor 1-like [Astatotilapia calliptera]
MDYGDYNYTFPDDNNTFPEIIESVTPEIQPIQIVALVMYSLVVLLGVPGNAVVVWVTGFCMSRSVTSLWFLNLALADLLCCLSIPLLMVPLVHDDHWHFGPLACMLIRGLFYLVMYCSILQLVVISVDRLLLVIRPIWCQNHRRPKQGAYGCVAVWVLALIGSIPQFVYAKQIVAGDEKRECRMEYTVDSAWPVSAFRFLIGFIIPFLVILVCHLVVFSKTQRRMTRGRTRSKKTLRVIIAVVLSFFLCWIPLHIVDFLILTTPRASPVSPKLHLAHVIVLCLAYFNSCLNPLLYVCLGQSFKDSMNRSLRNILQFISEDPTTKISITHMDTKSTSNGKEMTTI